VRWLDKIVLRFRSLWSVSAVDRELADEIRFHLDREIQERITGGMSEQEAKRTASVDFGGVERFREECRDMRRVSFIQDFVQDLLYGFRVLRKQIGFAAIVVITLALGIGANTLIFSVAYGVLLRPLPYPSPDKLVTLWESNHQKNSLQGQVSAANFYDWQRDNKVFSATTAYAEWRFNLTGVAEPESLSGALVTPDFFSVLGIKADQGRTFRPDEDQSGKDDVVVVSQALWSRIFGSTTALVGQTITLNRSVATVVGIMPADFAFPSRSTEIWVPLDLSPENKQNRDGRWLTALARLKPGVTQQQVTADMNVIASRLQASYPKADANVNIRVVSLHEYVVGETRTTILVLLGSVVLLLSLACANVASLFFARGSGRGGEFAVRYALGAGRGRMIRQLLTESAVLVTLGTFLGVLLAHWGVHAFRLLSIEKIPHIRNIKIDVPVIAFTVGISVFVAALVGLFPALRASSYKSLREGNNRLASVPAVQRRRISLVITQISFAFILLVGAGLLANSFLRLSRVSPGFQVGKRLSFRLALPRSKYKTNVQQISFFTQMLDGIGQQTGILGSGGVSDLPLLGNRMGFKVLLESPGSSAVQTPPEAGVRWVTSGYFDAIGMPVRRGRQFSIQDGADTLPVVVINQSMADWVWPGRDPIGLRVRLEEDRRWFTIIGIVGDIKQQALDSDEGPSLYFLYAQKSEIWLNWMSVVVRTSGDPRSLTSVIRGQVRSLDKDQPITDISTLEEHLADLEALPRFRMIVMGTFSFIAFCLSIVGIFGMISYSVAQRAHEIGIRMALGAQPGDVLRQFLGQGLRYILWGLTFGVLGALLLTRALKSLLFGVDPADGATFALVAAVLLVVAMVACWLPAWRATRIDPMACLRYE
jgi:putative ABC transport system permease protein